MAPLFVEGQPEGRGEEEDEREEGGRSEGIRDKGDQRRGEEKRTDKLCILHKTRTYFS